MRGDSICVMLRQLASRGRATTVLGHWPTSRLIFATGFGLILSPENYARFHVMNPVLVFCSVSLGWDSASLNQVQQ